MILLLLMNIIVGASAFLLVSRALKIRNTIDSLMAVFLLYFAQIVISELILGIFGILYLKNIIFLNLAILMMIWLATHNLFSSFSLAGLRERILQCLKNKVILFSIAVILGFSLVKVGVNLVNPPFGWDCLNYHFTFPVEWLKGANLNIPIVISDDPAPSYYPVNGSLFFLWFMLPLKNVFLADLAQVPFFILAFLAVYRLAKKVGLTQELSLYSAILFLLIPNLFKQLEVAYVDVMVGALFLTSVYGLFLLNESFSWQNVLLYSLSLGLLLGTKTVTLPYSILLLIPFIYLYCKKIKNFYWLIILLIGVLIVGGYSYIKNYVDTGNPLYPLNLKLQGKIIFKGVMDTATFRAHFKVADYRLDKILLHEGLGAQTLLLVFPSIFLALPLAIARKKKLNFNLAYFFILPLLLYLVYRYLIPLANLRYLYVLLGIGVISGFYLMHIFNFKHSAVKIFVIISVLLSVSEISKHNELIASLILAALFFFTLSYLIKNFRLSGALRKVLFSILFLGALIFLERYYVRNEFAGYSKMVEYSGFWPEATRAWEWLNKNTTGNNIAYVGRPVPFPLYGSGFKNNVYYVSVNKTDPAKLHYFPESRYSWGYNFLSLHKNLEAKGNYRSGANYAVWLSNLLRRNTDYIFIYSLHQIDEVMFPIEDSWAKNNPKKFRLIFSNDTIHIYRILK